MSTSKTGSFHPQSRSPMEIAQLRELVTAVVDRTMASRLAGAPASLSATRKRTVRPARWVQWPGGTPSLSAPASTPEPDTVSVQRASKGDRQAVAMGADHGGYRLKQQLARYVREELGYPVIDCGTDSEEAVDYPDIARKVAMTVAGGEAFRGIVIDAAGIGSGMAANRVPGALCAVCHDAATVKNAREHNDANVLSLGSRVVNPGAARQLVRLFLKTEHAGGRHARRVAKIRSIENIKSQIQRTV